MADNRLLTVCHGGESLPATYDELCEETDVVKMCRDAFEAVWERGIAHEDYQIS